MASIDAPSQDGGRMIVPRFAIVAAALEMHAPLLGLSAFGAAGARIVPSGSRTGLFLIGPRMPSGSRRASLHVLPPSRRRPHHAPPRARARADLVEQRERPWPELEEHRVPRGIPLAVRLHAVRHLDGLRPFAVALPRHQMPTSSAPSRVPPNHAATRPSRVSTIVDACALANGADSKINSTEGNGCASAAIVMPANRAHTANRLLLGIEVIGFRGSIDRR